ncbi:hypothetical protein [Pantoea phage LIMEzero]|uniref:Uncharacterized protein n=1 Tax=Pantoea phage LIMEzero TaxID=943335 RepID=F4N9V7_9CAUD|nr:hypothetical protein LIMEzero_ORF54 [Pantoea phage LIMEzero]CBY88585.1 hypothetical protein [Pantoea phage LIMEzero]
MENLEARVDVHERRITALEQGDAAMLLKLSENDARWQQVNAKLQVVDQIQDIQQTMSTIGKIFVNGAKVIRWCITTGALVCGIYIALHSGDLASLTTLIGQLIGMP